MNNLSTSDMKNTKEKLVNLKTNYLIIITRLKKILMRAKALNILGICLMKIITKKTNLYKAEQMKNLAVKNIKDLNEYKGIKDIRYLFNDNIYKGIIDTRYLFNRIASNEDYYVENIKSEFNQLSNNLVRAHTKDITYMVDIIILIMMKNLKKDPLIQKMLETIL